MNAWPYPRIFAHRGGGSLAPENTLAAMRKGREFGFRAVEFDVKLSADNVAVLMHDATLERTTNGAGKVADWMLAELSRLDAGGWHSPAFCGERIAALTDVAQFLLAQGMMANVEIKPSPGREIETGREVALRCSDLWRDHEVKPLLSSFSFAALGAARDAARELPRGFLVKTPSPALLADLEELGCVSLHCSHVAVDAAQVEFFHEHGYRVLTYTVNERERVENLFAFGVDGVFTDRLDDMARWFTGAIVPAPRGR